MKNKASGILNDVANYYSAKLAEHGETPRGVDWNSAEGQTLRFQQLIKIIDRDEGFSINDIGCGFGSLLEYLSSRYSEFSYVGYDVSSDMVTTATKRFAGTSKAKFVLSSKPEAPAEYSLASGIFNVRLENSDSEWLGYIESTLDVINTNSKLGFAFNCLTSYSDLEKMHDYLYYADPCRLFDLCKRKYSKHIALLHDYGLYEFTILVRKQV